MSGKKKIHGIIPVMLTPFLDDGTIDYPGLDRLTEWYLANGADALFAVCQSSEMQFLSLAEKTAVATHVVKRVAGRVPVLASGHTSDSQEDFLASLSHIPIALLGATAGWLRWLELRLPPGRTAKIAGFAWPLFLSAAGLVLLNYREI